jgi:hypothetical protein
MKIDELKLFEGEYDDFGNHTEELYLIVSSQDASFKNEFQEDVADQIEDFVNRRLAVQLNISCDSWAKSNFLTRWLWRRTEKDKFDIFRWLYRNNKDEFEKANKEGFDENSQVHSDIRFEQFNQKEKEALSIKTRFIDVGIKSPERISTKLDDNANMGGLVIPTGIIDGESFVEFISDADLDDEIWVKWMNLA